MSTLDTFFTPSHSQPVKVTESRFRPRPRMERTASIPTEVLAQESYVDFRDAFRKKFGYFPNASDRKAWDEYQYQERRRGRKR
jgi:hypothetical protein